MLSTAQPCTQLQTLVERVAKGFGSLADGKRLVNSLRSAMGWRLSVNIMTELHGRHTAPPAFWCHTRSTCAQLVARTSVPSSTSTPWRCSWPIYHCLYKASATVLTRKSASSPKKSVKPRLLVYWLPHSIWAQMHHSINIIVVLSPTVIQKVYCVNLKTARAFFHVGQGVYIGGRITIKRVLR